MSEETTMNDCEEIGWSSSARTAATIALVAFLFVLVMGPLSNPVGSRDLTLPLGRTMSPFYQATFLGHGYRFFAPDPGPSHIVTYVVKREDGTVIQGSFPNRESISPRLLYHRWFMLSETIYNEYVSLYALPFEEVDRDLEASAEALKLAGRFSIADSINEERARNRRQFDDSRKRFDELVGGVASWLLKENEGVEVELFLLERAIASPLDVLTGIELDDPRFLTDPERIWPIPPLPAMGQIPSLEEGPPGTDSPLFEEPEGFVPPLSDPFPPEAAADGEGGGS
ncbi:MAG: hypothetical protein AAF456_06850 [Planctomycetota bacterium]